MKHKTLLKSFMTLVALTVCLVLAPMTTVAQQSVPYSTTVGGDYLPMGWVAYNYGFEYNNIYWYVFTTGAIALPELNAPTNTLTIDVRARPFDNYVNGAQFGVGYITDVNDFGTYHDLKSFSFSEESWYSWRWKRVDLSGAPANARIALYSYYQWDIANVSVYETPDPVDVPYSLYTFGYGQPEGWIANNYITSDDYYFRTGTARLPKFTSNISSLQLDMSIKPRNSTAQRITIGYVDNDFPSGGFTALQTFTYSSSWNNFEPKRISFAGVPSGKQMAFHCEGEWVINGVSVTTRNPSSYSVPYQADLNMFLPEGWEAGNYLYSDGAYLVSGTALLPQFTSNLNTLQLDAELKPKDASAQSIEFGYINSNNTFVPLKSYSYSSSWTSFEPKTVLYSNASSSGRMAIRCNGNWRINSLTVSAMPNPIGVPYTANIASQTLTGWVAENYHRYNNTNSPYSWLSTGYAVLPQFNVALNTLQFDISLAPLDNNAQSISIGYITNPNNPSTFTAVKTYHYESTWYTDNYQPRRVYYHTISGLPSGARIAIYCNGNWKIDHVHVQLQSATQVFSVPHTPTMGNNSLPEGWISDNYFYYLGAYLSTGCAILPQFNVALSSLQLDICIAPRGSSSQSISIGYVINNNPATFTAVKTYSNSGGTYNNLQPKRIFFNVSGVPSGARMAINCGGPWGIRNLKISVIPATYTVPYTATLSSTILPEGWTAENYYYDGGACLTSGCAILPQFNVGLNTLQMDIALKPKYASAQSISIGYVTNNNPSTFTALQTFYPSSSWSSFWPKCIIYSGVPSNARMAISCNGDWFLGGVEAKTIQSSTTTFNVPYEASFSATMLPEGWITSNYSYSGTACFTSGCAILPRFNAAIGSLQMNLRAKPKNDDSQYISVGFVSNDDPSTFSPIQTFYNTSLWGIMQHKRILYHYSWIPSNVRMAILFSGEWFVNDVLVEYVPQPVSVPYTCDCYGTDCVGNENFNYYQADGWVANNYRYYGSDPLFGTGCAMLPEFNVPVSTLQLRMDIAPYKGFNGITPTSISLGYVTNSNPSTFVACQTINYESGWGVPVAKTVNFGNAPSNARIAFVCDGEWQCDNVHVSMPIQSLPYVEGFENTDVDDLPVGWSAQNMSVKQGSYNGVSPDIGNRQLVGNGYAILPNFDEELNTTTIELWCRPENTLSGGIFKIGYIPSGGSLSSFVYVKEIVWRANWTDYRLIRVSYENVPAGARAAIYCLGYGNGTNLFHIDGVLVKHPPVMALPFAENFDGVTLNNLPQGWLADNIRTGNQPFGNDAPHSGNRQLYGTGDLIFPALQGSLNGARVELWLRPMRSSSNLTLELGYVTNPYDMSTFVLITAYSASGWTQYQQKSVSLNSLNSNIPEGARLAIRANADSGCWYIDDVHVSIRLPEEVPYTQEFEEHSMPDGWKSYHGELVGTNSPYTATLSPTSGLWQFGAPNGVFDGSSHAYVNIGHYLHNFWLMSPTIHIPSESTVLSFDLALTRSTGDMVPIIPGDQTHTSIYVLISSDHGVTWTKLQAWKELNTAFSDLDNLTPEGVTMSYNISNYANQNVLIGFYMECTNASDASNRVHIDNFSVETYDPTLPPTSLSVSEVAGHSAWVHWEHPFGVTDGWDVYVQLNNGYWEPGTSGTTYHTDNNLSQYFITGLEPDAPYSVWVRHHLGDEVGEWSDWLNFSTVSLCAPPTNLQVEVTSHTALFTWDPGQSNQTSWETWWDGDDIGTVIVTEPRRLITGIDYNPDYDYRFTVGGYCEDGDGTSNSTSLDFNLLPLPTLTVNNSTNWDEYLIIIGIETGDNNSKSQFLIPAEKLTDMQYSTINKLEFYSGQNGNPWGNAQFKVYMAEVEDSNLNAYCGEGFYPWDDMTQVYTGSLYISNNVMTIVPDEGFHYHDGNLLIGIKQFVNGTQCQVSWYSVGTSPVNYALYEPWGYDPQCVASQPKVTFTYEPDDYLPPTDFEAYVTGGYEVSFFWTMRDGQTATEIMMCGSPDYIGEQYLVNSTQNHYTVSLPDYFEPEETYYYRYRGLYEVDGETHYSAWSQTEYFVMPDACEPPAGLQVTDITPYAAHLSWVSGAEYDEVEYRNMDDLSDALLDEDFDGYASGAFPDGWSRISVGGGNEWHVAVSTAAHTGRGFLTALVPQNSDGTASGQQWLILPAFQQDGCLSLWMRNANSFKVYVSTTGTNIEDFRFVQQCTRTISSGYEQFIIPITAQGNRYIAIVHDQIGTIRVDDISYSPWNFIGSTEDGEADLTSLTPGTAYQFRVKAYCDTGYESDWSQPSSFVTTELCDAPTNLQVNEVGAFTAHLSWESEAESDYVEYKELAGDDWIALGSTEGGQIDLTGLMYGTTYQARVSALCNSGFPSDYTDPISFSTLTNIVFADANVKSECVDSWDTNGDNELSYAEAAVVTDIETLFRNNSTITSFNELQYFTGLTSIASNAFAGCSGLTAVTLPNTITSIGQNAFGINSQGMGCTSLNSIVFPNSLTTIGFEAFYQSGLTEVNLPYSVTYIGPLAFGDCNNLVAVSLPATVTQIEGNAFTGTSIASIEVDPGNPVYDSRNGCNAIIKTATNELITGCKNTVVPDGVTTIGISAFENCTGLTSISLPATLETIKDWAFLNCHGLTTIEVQAATPPTMEEYAFMNLNLADITVYVPCGYLEAYEDSDWSGFNLVENCNIVFEDLLTKQLCVDKWDLNIDGELNYREAAAVTDLENWFNGEHITRFNELQYFIGLTIIYEDDFADCVDLVSITFPPTVTYIDGDAFLNCTSLTTLTFGENIGTINNYAFTNCTGLTFIKVEATTPPSLGEHAFHNVDCNFPVYVPCGTKADYQNDSDWDVFDDANFIDLCDNIYFVDSYVKALCVASSTGWDTNHDGELSYGEAAAVTDLGEVFRRDLNIRTFDELRHFTGLTEIGAYAFSGSAWLQSVTIPSTVTTIGRQAFYNTFLGDITLPASVRSIDFLAFCDCHVLGSVTLPASVTYLNGNPFSYCYNLTSITVQAGNPVYDSRSSCDAIIETATNTLVVGCQNTEIPNTVTTLGNYSFSGQTHLTSLTIPASVTSLGTGVFENATGLTEIYMKATTPPTLGYNVFDRLDLDDIWVYVPCGTLGDYENDDDGWGLFYYIIDPCANISFADANVKAICVANWDTGGDGELSYGEAAEVTDLGTAFKNNTTITSFNELKYFTGLNDLGAGAFYGCTALAEVSLPKSLGTIYNGVFAQCTQLESIVIPASVTDIWFTAFDECASLESIVVEPGNAIYDSRNDCNAIIVTLSNTLQVGCNNTVIPEDVVAIGQNAFSGRSHITAVVLPASVGAIGFRAFYNCTSLTAMIVQATTPPTVDMNAFNGVPTDIPVYVPCGTVEDYQVASGWSDFTNLIDNCPELPQYFTLVEGWNWWAPTVRVTFESLATVFEGDAPLINTQDGGFARYDNGSWDGTMGDVFEPGQMYKILFESDGTYQVIGTVVSPVTVTIDFGYTWFGYTGEDGLSIASALGNFTPSEGDQIIAEDGAVATFINNMWTGDLTTLLRGHGYIYVSTDSQSKTLTF